MLKPRQKQVLDFVLAYRDKKGGAPSLEEIKKHLRLNSVSTAHYHVKKLQESGHLQKEYNQARALDIPQPERMVRIPLLGRIAAGQPIEAIREKESIAVPQSMLAPTGEFFALRVAGDSMIDEDIYDGDIVLVKQQSIAENGQKVVALIDGFETTLKKYYKETDHIRLQPANRTLEPIIVHAHQEFAIQGVVLDVIKNEDELEAKGLITPKDIKRRGTLPVNKILCGDVLSELRKLPDNSIDLAITSPPYNLKNSTGNGMKDGRGGKWSGAALVHGYSHHDDNMPHEEYVRWQRACIAETMRTLKEDGALFYNHKWRVQGGLLQDRNDIVSGFPVRQIIIWRRKGGINFNKGYFLPTYEVIYLIAKPKFTLKQKANALGDVWEFSQEMNNPHPAPYPVNLIDRIISSTEAQVILDPFMGSGTTAISAINHDREYIGIEVSPEYCKMARDRIKNHKKGLGDSGFVEKKQRQPRQPRIDQSQLFS